MGRACTLPAVLHQRKLTFDLKLISPCCAIFFFYFLRQEIRKRGFISPFDLRQTGVLSRR